MMQRRSSTLGDASHISRHASNSSAYSANANPDEDWTKITDLAERRRIQNRIAQRNYRKKLKLKEKRGTPPTPGSDEHRDGPRRSRSPARGDAAPGRTSSKSPLPHLQDVSSSMDMYATQGMPWPDDRDIFGVLPVSRHISMTPPPRHFAGGRTPYSSNDSSEFSSYTHQPSYSMPSTERAYYNQYMPPEIMSGPADVFYSMAEQPSQRDAFGGDDRERRYSNMVCPRMAQIPNMDLSRESFHDHQLSQSNAQVIHPTDRRHSHTQSPSLV